MINWRFWERKQKSAPSSYIRTMIMRNSASWTAFDFFAFATEGYAQNPTVRACVRAITAACADLPITVVDDQGNIKDKAKILQQLKRPNSKQTYQQLITEIVTNRLISGEGAIYNLGVGSQFELMALRPDWLSIVETEMGYPKTWVYSASDAGMSAMRIPDEMLCKWFEYNPVDRYRGLSLLSSCAYAIDTLNSYASSNKAVLDNGVTPSGVLSTATELSDTSFGRLQTQFSDKYAGAKNNGKPMILEGGLSWQQTGMSPREMEYINGKRANELDVCKVLGVPPQIVGIEGSQTFANYEQARASFYEDTVIPLMNGLLSDLQRYIDPRNTSGGSLCVEVDKVTALEPRRAERMKTVDGVNSLTINEKRGMIGKQAVDEGDVILVQSSMIPLDLAGADPVSSTSN